MAFDSFFYILCAAVQGVTTKKKNNIQGVFEIETLLVTRGKVLV
jgi:hypothetical protein